MIFKSRCRCGASLDFSAEDLATGMPAEGADYWCSDPKKETGPHDWGVVTLHDNAIVLKGVKS